MPDPILETEALTRRFAGLLAVNAVTLSFAPGRIHAVIGPNGAGKSTLINLLSGEIKPSAGRIRFLGRDITGATPDMVSRLGIGRSFQKTNVFPRFTAFENCRLAAQSRLRSSMRFFRPASRYEAPRRAARQALERVGLGARAEVPAQALSHGEQRQLEIAMVLASSAKLLLLDEPLAGMGAEESRAAVALLKEIGRDHTLVLVEHDMDAVFAIADTLTVMVNGEVVASGPVETVRANRAVQDAYLGHAEDAP